MSETVQLKVSLWKEDQEIGVKWPPAGDPVELSVDKISVRGAAHKRTRAREAEESPSVKSVANKRLVETVID
jgi:hypothetical protein